MEIELFYKIYRTLLHLANISLEDGFNNCSPFSLRISFLEIHIARNEHLKKIGHFLLGVQVFFIVLRAPGGFNKTSVRFLLKFRF